MKNNKQKPKKISKKKVEILATDDLKTFLKKIEKIRVKIPGNDSVKFIHKNR